MRLTGRERRMLLNMQKTLYELESQAREFAEGREIPEEDGISSPEMLCRAINSAVCHLAEILYKEGLDRA